MVSRIEIRKGSFLAQMHALTPLPAEGDCYQPLAAAASSEPRRGDTRAQAVNGVRV